MKDNFSMSDLYQFMTTVLTIVLCLYLIVLKRWIIGPFLILAGYFQLLSFCLVGTAVDTKNDMILEAIYNSLWYRLPFREQKKLCLMLMRSQRSPRLTIGKFAYLNVDTFMKTTKAIYTYFMMILEWLGN